jgi:CheY-like chemotaxis protein
MPRKTGFDVIRWIRQKPQYELLPTVVLTASESDPDIKRAYRLGANSYLVKPPTLEKITTLAKNLDRYWLTLNRAPQRSD